MRVHFRALISGQSSQLIALKLTGWTRGIQWRLEYFRDLTPTFDESGSAQADEVLGRAGLVVVATSAGESVVVDRQLRADATVLAVGAHTVDTRELHEDVLRGAQVIVEDVGAARREAGDVTIAVEKGALAWDDVVTMAEVVRGEVALDPARRAVFKTVGMPWEDLAVARAVARQVQTGP